MPNWLTNLYHDIRPNARWDLIKWVAKLIIWGALALFAWYSTRDTSVLGIPRTLIAIAVFAVLAFAFAAVAFGISRLRTKEPKQESPPMTDSKLHEDCDRKIHNLQSQIGRLRERDQTWGVQVSARDGQIEQLKTELGKDDWLRQIAATQRGAIERYVGLDYWILEHSLIQDPLMVDFRFRLKSSSVYRLSATRVSGWIRFGNRRLGTAVPANYPPRIVSNETDDLAIGDEGYLTISQPLTREDAVSILNGGGEFFFDGLFIELQTFPETGSTPKLSPLGSISNKEIREAYPKLDLKFKQAGYFHFVDTHEDVADRNQVITLDVIIENGRKSIIDIDSVQLSVVNIGHPTLQLLPDAGEIYEKKFVGTDGSINTFGKRLKNLAASRLAIIGRGKVSGCFQFSVEGVAIDALTDASVSLILTDKYGEHHVGNHDLAATSSQ